MPGYCVEMLSHAVGLITTIQNTGPKNRTRLRQGRRKCENLLSLHLSCRLTKWMISAALPSRPSCALPPIPAHTHTCRAHTSSRTWAHTPPAQAAVGVWGVIHLEGARNAGNSECEMYFFLRATVRGSHTVMRTPSCRGRRTHQASSLWLWREKKHTQVHLSLGRLLIVFVDTGPEGGRCWCTWWISHTQTDTHTHEIPTEIVQPNVKDGPVVVDNNRTALSQPYTNKHCILKQSETTTFRTINVNAVHLYAKRFALWSQEEHWQIDFAGE